jgi:hypothetical protein
MAVIKLTDALFYKAGTSGVSAVVGMDGGDATRVVRYTIKPPSEGSRGFTLTFAGKTLGSKNEYYDEIPIHYYIGTSDSSHVNADGSYEYTGVLTRNASSNTFTASSNVILFPGKTYYLWLFPGKVAGPGVFCWYYWNTSENDALETGGGIGLAYIGSYAYEISIYNGVSWDRYEPHIYNGSSWDDIYG